MCISDIMLLVVVLLFHCFPFLSPVVFFICINWLPPIGCCYFTGEAGLCLLFGALMKNQWWKHVGFCHDWSFDYLAGIMKAFNVFTSVSFLLGTEVFLAISSQIKVPSVRSEVSKSRLFYFGHRSFTDSKLETLVPLIWFSAE